MRLRSFWRGFGLLLLLAAQVAGVRAFVLDSKLWLGPTVTMQLQLDPSPLGRTLIDGSTSWGQVAETALTEWNATMAGMQFAVVRNSGAAISAPNGLNNVFFSNTVYGDAWGSGVIGVAITYSNSTRRIESDVIFNSGRSWDSYRGNLRSALDLKRVALHEFGHVVGLNHPDQFGQSLTAIMNSTIGNLDALAADDRAGAVAAYGAPPSSSGTAPTILGVNFAPSVSAGATVTFTVTVSGTSPFTYVWKKGTTTIPGATSASLILTNVQPDDGGSYTVTVSNNAGSATSTPAVLTVTSIIPALITQPSNQTVNLGGTATFSVAATGSGTLTFQWYRNNLAIPGANSASLILGNIQLSQAGSYTVTVSSGAGSVTSTAATLTVNAPAVGPTIQTHPASQTVYIGGSVMLSVVATGTAPFSYQWQRDGAAMAGATSSSLTLSNLQVSDSGGYSVVVSNSVFSVTSNTAAITVSPVVISPTIGTPPSSVTVQAGAPASFSAVVFGSAPLTFVWRKNGTVVALANHSVLSFNPAQTGDAGSYTITISNGAGSVTSPPAILTVTAPATAPSIQVAPTGQTVLAGASVTFSVAANGTAPLLYQWLKDGLALAGATASTLVLNVVQATDAGRYAVTVSNAGGSVTSAAAVLMVTLPATVPTLIGPPASLSVPVGSPATFSVIAGGAPPLTYQWRQGNVVIARATQSAFAISAVQLTDGGGYTVTVSNSLGSVTSVPAVLTVLIPASAPVIQTQPVNVGVTTGGSATFSVAATGTSPLSYQWRKDGVALTGATGATLALSGVQSGQAGVYSVVVSNGAGSVASAGATLTVNPVVVAPRIDAAPTGRVATEGANLTFSVVASGSAPLTYQWFKAGAAIPGATQATLFLANVQLADAGLYTVVVGNAVGSVTSPLATLVVNSLLVPPAITVPPTGRTAVEGSAVTLEVTATGSAPLVYQWRRNGAILVGATTAALTLTNLLAGDAGDYTVVVSNAAGNVASAPAALVVTRRPVSWISNVSIRTTLGANQPLIVGLSMAGGAKPVLVRAVGPGLAAVGVGGAMPDPELALFGDSQLIAGNNDWGGGTDLAAAFAAVGAFGLSPGSLDAAILGPVEGGRTAQVSGPIGGVVLVEAYDAGTGDLPRLVNVSARNRIGPAGDLLIAGFTLTGDAAKTILIRAIGPTLTAFGVPGALVDPKVEVYSGTDKVAENDDWPSSLAATFGSVGAFGLNPGGKDAALVLTLAPGGYTVQVSGVGGASGETLIELYEVPVP